ncbi:hypothetical protein HY095_01155 [Candidatus Micrarchaeota archaeon]|nr:hypothetical protein [Candidatus Micrarchaeota archaeon]
MLTIGSENDELGEFEQSIEKFKRISEDRVSLLSGDPLLADRIYRNVNQAIDLETVARQVYENMVALRVEGIKRRLALMNLQIDDVRQMLSSEIKNQFAGDLLEFYNKYTIQTGVLLLGFCNENKGHIYHITERAFDDHREMNFARGVGHETDLMVLSKSIPSKVKKLDDGSLKILGTIYDEEVSMGKNHKELVKLVGGNENEPKLQCKCKILLPRQRK